MKFLIAENEYFRIEHSYSCAVPGYLIVSPTINVNSISELPDSFLKQTGVSLAAATRLVEEVIKPVKIYCAQFGEEGGYLHFHIFPRSASLTREYLNAYPEQKELIHGPLILDWARTKYKYTKEKVWSVASPAILEMIDRISTHTNGSKIATRFSTS